MQQKKKLLTTYKGNSINITAYFSSEIMKGRRKWDDILIVEKISSKMKRYALDAKTQSVQK